MSENSRLLKEAMETVVGMYKCDIIDIRRLREYKALCATVHKFTDVEVKELRNRIKVSQPVLAQLITTSVATIRAWEAGQKILAVHLANFWIFCLAKALRRFYRSIADVIKQ